MMTTPISSSSELSFDCKPHIYSMLQKSFGDDQQIQKLEEFVALLEEERLKIDAFKRELPLCMQLLTYAMEASTQHLQLQRSSKQQLGSVRPVLEEFIPLKNMMISSSNTTEEKQLMNNNLQENSITADKANWMTSAQLWNQENEEIILQSAPLTAAIISPPDQDTEIKLGLNGKQRINGGGGGAFLPFSLSKDHDHRVGGGEAAFPELALASSHKEDEIMEDKKNINYLSPRKENNYSGNNKCGNSSCGGGEKDDKQVSATTTNNNTTTQSHRKARRCWSPDLHRRFVNALHMLGGSQVATPKQIRELMKVDGLTNDEVKSHLQKYRLHTRRPSPSPQAALTAAPQVVVLGGIWVPQEYAAAAAHGGAPTAAALYGATGTHHHVTSPFCTSAPPPLTPQEIYPAIAPPPSMGANPNYQIHHHQQVHLYNKPPLTQINNSSPESDIHGGSGDPSESIEDGKSESDASWKADSGGERRS